MCSTVGMLAGQGLVRYAGVCGRGCCAFVCFTGMSEHIQSVRVGSAWHMQSCRAASAKCAFSASQFCSSYCYSPCVQAGLDAVWPAKHPPVVLQGRQSRVPLVLHMQQATVENESGE